MPDSPTSLELPYPEHNLIVRAERLWEGSHGKVQGQLSVRVPSANGHYTVLLVPEDFGFTARSARKEIIKYLAERAGKIDWTIILDDVCDQVIQYTRKGQPDAQIDPAKIILTQPTYLIYPFLPRGQPTVFYGKKSSAKSTLLLLMALALASGYSDNPWFKGIKTPVRTGWLDWETDQQGFEYDVKRLADGNGIVTCQHLYYRHGHGRLFADQVEEIKDWVQQRQIEFLVLDSVAAACGEIKEAHVASNYYNALQYLGLTSASIAHPPKSELTISSSVSGAGQFEDRARNIWETDYEQEEDSPTGFQALRHRKNYKTGYLPSVGYRYEYSQEVIIVSRNDPNEVSKHVAKASLRVRALNLLSNGPQSLKAIKEGLDIKGDYISIVLNRAAKDGEVELTSSGNWQLKK